MSETPEPYLYSAELRSPGAALGILNMITEQGGAPFQVIGPTPEGRYLAVFRLPAGLTKDVLQERIPVERIEGGL